MNLQNLNLVELNAQEVQEVEGGFIPLLIWGIAISAETVATAFFVGVGVGAAVAQGQK
ncbi:bacteriocin [Flavobacterium hiemivividum]|uniref:bacteriocin n=1 Tax=Flavobacterium hiemivividum TaxID=2541734 RepID=UPI001FB5DEEC|nr:bacteriocin [Flavobacterium hiemivividum]